MAPPLVALALFGATPQAARGQEDADRAPSMACWRGAPLPECGGFVLVEAQGTFPLAQTSAPGGPFGPAGSPPTFETRLEWNLGYMVNVGPRWAFGGGVTIGTGATELLTGVRARARRWLGPELSVEFDAGILRTRALYHHADVTGLTADVRLNVDDMGALFLRWDGVDVPAFHDPYGPFYERGGFRQALSVGVGAGSSWALKGTAVAGTMLGLWMILFLSSYHS